MKLLRQQGRVPEKLLAREALHRGEEPEFVFDPHEHLKLADWKLARKNLQDYSNPPNPVSALDLLFYMRLVNPESCHQVLHQPGWTEDLSHWLESLGEAQASETVNAMLYQGLAHRKIESKIFARNLFPDQPLFQVTVEDLNRFLSEALDQNTFNILFWEYLKKQCPKVTADPTLKKPIHVPFDDSIKHQIIRQLVIDLSKPIDGRWAQIIYETALMRIVDPDSLSTLTLDATFWKKALHQLKEMQTTHLPSLLFFQYAAQLKVLAAQSVNLDEQGNLVLEDTPRAVGHGQPLPLRDVS